MKRLIWFIFTLLAYLSICKGQVSSTSAEYFFGSLDPGVGLGTPLIVIDGNWDDVTESLVDTLRTHPSGLYPLVINLRVKDNAGNWSPLFRKTIFRNAGDSLSRLVNITAAEYFFAVFDPGEGQGTPILTYDGVFDDAIETIFRSNTTWTVTNQPTLFNIRVKDANNNWGPLFRKTVFPYGANPSAELIAQGDSLKVCPGANVTLTYNGPNGYTPTWFNGVVGDTVSFTVTSSGYYGVSASLGNSNYSDSIYIDFLSTPAPIISPSGSILVCATSVLSLTTIPISNTTYQWYYNNNLINGANTSSYIPTQIGNYYLEATSNGCIGKSDIVTLFFSASISPLNAVRSCASPVQLNAPQGTGNTYQWRLNGINIPGATASTFNANVSGNYSILLSNGSCSSNSFATSVTIDSIPTTPAINASGSTTFCSGNSVVLTSSSATGNTWSNGATTQSITVTQSGSYSVTVSNGLCSASSALTVVTVNPLPTTPTINAGGSTTFCSGDSVVLTSSNATGNTWSNGATTQSITVTQSGSYSVTVSNGLCSASSAPTVVTVNSIPIVTILPLGSTNFCQGDSVILQASAGNSINFQWKINGSIIAGATNSIYNATVGGNYSVQVISSYGCEGISSNLNVVVQPRITAGPIIGQITNINTNQQYIYAVSQTLNRNYSWNVTNGAILNGQGSNSITVLWGNFNNGQIQVIETYLSCSDTSDLIVQISPGTSVHEKSLNAIQLRPNPTNGLIYLKSENLLNNVRIFNSIGQVILDDNLTKNEIGIDLSNYSNGVYYIIVDFQVFRLILSK